MQQLKCCTHVAPMARSYLLLIRGDVHSPFSYLWPAFTKAKLSGVPATQPLFQYPVIDKLVTRSSLTHKSYSEAMASLDSSLHSSVAHFRSLDNMSHGPERIAAFPPSTSGRATGVRDSKSRSTTAASAYGPGAAYYSALGTGVNVKRTGRGAFIVFEGLDRSGKTTQCQQLVAFLKEQGLNVDHWRFPDRNTEVGKMISAYLTNVKELDDEFVHLLFTANRFEKKSELLRLLENGTTLVVDRYAYSGAAYSTAKGLKLEWCKGKEEGLPAPDIVVYLNLPPEAAAARGGYGEERFEKVDFQKKVARQFERLRGPTWVNIDACKGLDEIQDSVRAAVLPIVERCARQNPPLSSLWSSNSADGC
eukprot:jgi/Mesen1/9438/ME000618S08815